MSHRTVRCVSGATTTSHQRSTATAFNALQCAPKSEHAQLAHRIVYRTCPVHHRTAQRPHQSELQRSNPNGRVTWLAHRTVRCTLRQTTTEFPNDHFGGWGYKCPPTTTLQGIQAFTTPHSIQEQYTTLQDTNQSLRSNQSPQFNSSS